MDNKDGMMVLPGDEIAFAEEFEPGVNTYEEGGLVRASIIGKARLDMKDRVATVEPANPLVELQEGDLVIGKVTGFRKGMATVDLVKVVGKDRAMLPVIGDGTIHVSKVSHDYIEDITKELNLTDIVRARVVKVRPHIQLSTEDENLGVLKSLCEECGTPMKRKGPKLYCQECDKFYYRKLSDDYGFGEEKPS